MDKSHAPRFFHRSDHCVLLALVCLLSTSVVSITPVSAKPTKGDKNNMRAGMGFGKIPHSSAPKARDVSPSRIGSSPSVPTTITTIKPSRAEHEAITETAKPTRKPYNCSESHRPHQNDSNKFQVSYNSVWWDQVCQTGLVWNQTLCRCDYPQAAYGDLVTECSDYRPHGDSSSNKYDQRVNSAWVTRDCNVGVSGLVWNQTACKCVWGPEGESDPDSEHAAPCYTMLNLTFEEGLVDEAKSSFLDVKSGSKVALRPFRSRDGKHPNMAAYFLDAIITVWYFASNELSSSLRVELKFKADNSSQTRDRFQILLSNGCNITGPGYVIPSLAIGYRAADTSFLLAMHTRNVRKAIVCTRDLEPYAWHHLSLLYEDGQLLFRVDNQPCIISTDFSGGLQKTACPLTIGADPLEKESKYIGYLDDVVVARYCRRFVEQPLMSALGQNNDSGTAGVN